MKTLPRNLLYWAREGIMELVLVAICIYLAVNAEGFLTVGNFLNILRYISLPGIIAFGMTMVIIAGEIDLSVGYAVSFSGCVTLALLNLMSHPPDWPHAVPAFILAGLAGIFACALAGMFTGFMRVRFGVPTFISTLAWMTILHGLAGLISGNGFPITTFPEWFATLGHARLFKTPGFAGLPVQTLLFIGVFLLLQFTMNYTTFGRSIYAVGGNAEAARLSGINVRFIKVAVMAIVGALAGLAGIFEASSINRAAHDSGTGWELDIIASVIIGGTSLTGGAGRIWGTLIGVIFLGIVENGMTMMPGLESEYKKYIVRGVIIFLAVLSNVAIPRVRK